LIFQLPPAVSSAKPKVKGNSKNLRPLITLIMADPRHAGTGKYWEKQLLATSF